MWALLSTIGILLLTFFLPAFYAAALVLLESILGESACIHVIVFVVFILVALYAVYIFLKNKPYRKDQIDETEKKDNDW